MVKNAVSMCRCAKVGVGLKAPDVNVEACRITSNIVLRSF